jgi:DNA primase
VVSQYVKLDRAGSSLRARCPFHAEKTPSFHVSPDRGTYHCFGCGVGGDIFTFVQAIEGLDFKGALKILAEKAGVPLVYARAEKKDDTDRLFELMEAATIFYQSRLTDEAKEYLKKRGLEEGTIHAFRIGYAGDSWSDASDTLRGKKFTERELLDSGISKKNERGGLADKFRNRIMFPIADSAGRIVAFSGRTFGEKAHPDAPKYLNSPETPLYRKSRILYGFDLAKQAIRKHNAAVLVEGQMDLVASHQAGWTNTVAVSGTAFTPEHASLLKRMSENLVLALDADEAGIKAAGRAARIALQGGLNVKVAALPGAKDPADLIQTQGKDAWSSSIRDAKDIITFLLDVLETRLPKRDQFRRAVETIVLPFLSDVQSPIAREQYSREIAERLGVSEGAVLEALKRTPREPSVSARAPETIQQKLPERARQAYAILIWQEKEKKPALDLAKFTEELSEALGEKILEQLRALPEKDQEEMRFSVERMYAKSTRLDREVAPLLSAVLKDRLSKEFATATARMKEAERTGDDEAVEKLAEECRILAKQIAKIKTEA